MASFKHLGKIYHTSCTFEGGEQARKSSSGQLAHIYLAHFDS